MIKLKISDLLGKYKKSQLWLCEKTGIRPATISNYYHEKISRLNKDDLEKIFNTFYKLDNNLKTTDLIEYIPEKAEK
ncbi:helix-turn-helix domain-containing protein [Clostridium felsineum]|uniref:helix-turn-helix domain-containing protein n=1 Tax=Clostridium felsineum TaxID=36839 RepID=UPI00098BF1CB|nr:helix-turn-helix transcriptional regulator [Clostridium felsineum]URZ00579.1 hypothetical protein CLAUR_005670 [Clostridium felsineum]